AGGRMHVPVRTCNEKGPVPPATEPKCLLEPVDLRPSTLGLLLSFFSLAQRPTDPPTRRLGCRTGIGKGRPFAGCGQHLIVALTPGTAGLPAVADRPVQRGETTPLPGQGRRKLRRRLPCVLIEGDRIRGAHIEPELLDQRCPGSFGLPGADVHVSFSARDRSELAPIALLPGVSLADDAAHLVPPDARRFPPGQWAGRTVGGTRPRAPRSHRAGDGSASRVAARAPTGTRHRRRRKPRTRRAARRTQRRRSRTRCLN